MPTKKTTTKAVKAPAADPLTLAIIEQSSLQETAALDLMAEFGTPLLDAKKLVADYKAQPVLIVTDEKDRDGMKKAGELRKAFKAARLAVAKQHKEVKAEALNRSNAVDLVKRLTLAELEPIEAHLSEQEKFAEVKALERLAITIKERQEELAPFVDDVTIFDFGDMSDHAFDTLLENSKLAHRARIDAEKAAIAKAEKEAKALEDERRKQYEAEKAAREKAEAEAAKLRAEQRARDEQAAKENAERAAVAAAAEAALAFERKEREKLEAEKAAAEKAQAEQERLEKEALAKLVAAPDKEKLLLLIDELDKLNFTAQMTSPAGRTIAARIHRHLSAGTAMYRELIEKELS